jgi:hypothetical protein
MSQANVEVVERTWDAWNRADLDGVLSFYAPEVEVDFTRVEGWRESNFLRSASEFRSFLTDRRTTWDSHQPILSPCVMPDLTGSELWFVSVAVAGEAAGGSSGSTRKVGSDGPRHEEPECCALSPSAR